MKLIQVNNVHLIVIVVVAMILASNAQGEKLNGAIDIVAILNLQSEEWDRDMMMVQNAYFEFLKNHFEFGNSSNSKTRMAAVSPFASNNSVENTLTAEKVVLNLTDDMAIFKQNVTDWNPIIHNERTEPDGTTAVVYRPYMHQAFNAINEIIFASDVSGRCQVVIVGLASGTHEIIKTTDAAKKLCSRGIHIYASAVEYLGDNPNHPHYFDVRHPPMYLCDKDNFFIIPNETTKDITDGLIRIKQKMAADLCGWEKMCRFVDGSSGKCEPDVWQMVSRSCIKQEQCQKFKPTITCTEDDCHKTCDEKWPWEKTIPKCDEVPCGTTVYRGKEFNDVKSETMREKLKKHCPNVFACPPCPVDPPVDKNLTRRIEEVKEETKVLTNASIGIIICVIVVVVLIAITSLIGLLVFLKKEKAEKSVKDTKMDAILEATSIITAHMATMQKIGGAEAETEADLSDRESKRSLKTSESSTKLKVVKSMAIGKKK